MTNFHGDEAKKNYLKKKKNFCFIPMKISHKLCVRMDGTQFLSLWWFTAKNEGGNHKRAWVYCNCQVCFQKSNFSVPLQIFWPSIVPALHCENSGCCQLLCIIFVYLLCLSRFLDITRSDYSEVLASTSLVQHCCWAAELLSF